MFAGEHILAQYPGPSDISLTVIKIKSKIIDFS